MNDNSLQFAVEILASFIADKVVERLSASQSPGDDRDDCLLTTEQAAEVTNIPRKTLESYRAKGVGPKYLRVEGLVRYRRSDLLKSG